MSSIAVYLHHNGRPVERRVLAGMLVAGVGRLPASTWVDGALGIGVLSPRTNTDRGRLVTDGVEGVIFAWDGHLDNRDEIRTELGLQPASRALPDAWLAKAAYKRWGEDFVTHLAGEFALVVWDRRRRCLLAGRDALGIRPLHFARSGNCVLIASLIRQLLATGLVSDRLNDGIIADYLIGVISTPEETFFSEIYRVPPGAVIDFATEPPRKRRFWFPESIGAIRYRNEHDYHEHFQDLLIGAVRARLPAAEPVGLLLSGGIDSASVAALVAEIQRQDATLPQGLVTLTVTFEEPADSDERRFADLVNERYGFDAEYVNGDQEWSFKSYEQRPRLPPWDEPLGNVHDAVMRALVARARGRGLEIVLTGDGADLLLTGTYYYLLDLLLSGQWRRMLREIGCFPVQLRKRLLLRYVAKPLMFAPLWSTLEYTIPGWVSPALLRRVDLEGRQRAARVPRGWRRPSFHLELETITTPELSARMPGDQYEALRYGIELRHPFFDKRVIEFLMGVPVTYKVERGSPKAVLRHAMRNRLPESIRQREHFGGFGRVLNRGLREREYALCEACFAQPLAGDLGYVDPAGLRQAYRRYLDGEVTLNYALADTLRLELWLRERVRERAHDGV